MQIPRHSSSCSVTNTMFLTGIRSVGSVPPHVMTSLLDIINPVNVAQNTLTTSLIVYRIYSQHRQFCAAGLYQPRDGRMSLLTFVRIVIESALIITMHQILLLILLQLNSPAQAIFHATSIPSFGESDGTTWGTSEPY